MCHARNYVPHGCSLPYGRRSPFFPPPWWRFRHASAVPLSRGTSFTEKKYTRNGRERRRGEITRRGCDEDEASAVARSREADRARREEDNSPPATDEQADVAGSGLTDVLESPPDHGEMPNRLGNKFTGRLNDIDILASSRATQAVVRFSFYSYTLHSATRARSRAVGASLMRLARTFLTASK